jgi:hypothetical protein
MRIAKCASSLSHTFHRSNGAHHCPSFDRLLSVFPAHDLFFFFLANALGSFDLCMTLQPFSVAARRSGALIRVRSCQTFVGSSYHRVLAHVLRKRAVRIRSLLALDCFGVGWAVPVIVHSIRLLSSDHHLFALISLSLFTWIETVFIPFICLLSLSLSFIPSPLD